MLDFINKTEVVLCIPNYFLCIIEAVSRRGQRWDFPFLISNVDNVTLLVCLPVVGARVLVCRIPPDPQLEPTARSDSDTWERHPSFVISLHNTQRRLLSLPLKWKWWKNILPPGRSGRVLYGWGKKSVEAGEGSFVCWGDGRMKQEWRLQKNPLPPPQAAETWPVLPHQKPF